MKLKPTKQNHGFTIIEIMIVLAIAGLIMAIVFLAVPALRRSANNTQRKNDAANILALVNEYASNQGGAIPTEICYTAGPPSTESVGGGASCPASNAVSTNVSGQITTVNIAATVPATLPTLNTSTLWIFGTATCSNANTVAAGSSSRSVAAYYGIEPATVNLCQGS